MIIDAHTHLHVDGLTADGLVARMDRDGVERCWLMSWEEHRLLRDGRHPMPVEEVFAAAAAHGDRLVPFYAPDPSVPGAAERLRLWASRGAAGCAELKVPLRWDDARVGELLAAVQELGMVLTFHMEDVRARPAAAAPAAGERPFAGYLLDFDAMEARLAEFSGVRFIGHGPLFWKGVESPIDGTCAYPAGPVAAEGVVVRLLAEYPNLHADLSGRSGLNALTRDASFGPRFAARFSHKLLYGTDSMELGLRGALDALALPPAALARILGDNARRLLAARPPPPETRAG